MPKSLTVTAAFANSGTIFVGDVDAGLREGIGLTAGQSLDLGSVPTGGHVWGEPDPTTVYIRATAGTGDDVIFTYYVTE